MQSVETNRDQLLVEWSKAKQELDRVKAHEMELRRQIVEESGLFNSTKETGTETVKLGNGWAVKATKKINYKLDNSEGETFRMLEQLAALGEASQRAAANLIKWSPDLRVSKYKELTDAERALVDEILTTSPGTPSLELVPPKS